MEETPARPDILLPPLAPDGRERAGSDEKRELYRSLLRALGMYRRQRTDKLTSALAGAETFSGSVVGFVPALLTGLFRGKLNRADFCIAFSAQMRRAKLRLAAMPAAQIRANQMYFKNEFALADALDRLCADAAADDAAFAAAAERLAAACLTRMSDPSGTDTK
ncbi:MAG: hypothetical protein IJK02_02720 [Clostridia bacterium]|nr:hypothetical protein [Clostridia bacterium]MBR0510020.1 hypothetical protein [Clostridia bacterium]MBR0537529.1 hypothetical protein [Clostridia bacterium]